MEETMSQNLDDLEAVRILVSTLEKFEKNDQERIIRWAKEKLGIPIIEQSTSSAHASVDSSAHAQDGQRAAPHSKTKSKDLKSFYEEKKPSSDMQFATFVAYYYKFEAPESERKDNIDSEILQDATRLANRDRLNDPNKTLRNAKFNGYLDSGEGRGFYKINTVGENLIAMTLPQESSRRTNKKKGNPKKGNSKKSTKK